MWRAKIRRQTRHGEDLIVSHLDSAILSAMFRELMRFGENGKKDKLGKARS